MTGIRDFTYLGDQLSAEQRAHIADLCDSPYFLPEYFEIFRPDARAHWLLVHREGTRDLPLAFTERGRTLELLTQTFHLAAAELEGLAAGLFARFPRARQIDVDLSGTAPDALAMPTIKFRDSEDYVAELPDRLDAYLARLGPRTRKHAPYYVRRLQREVAGYRFEIRRGREIDPPQVARIVALNRARMRGQDKVSGIDDAYLCRLQRLARVCGVVAMIYAGDEVIAGAICSQLHDQTYLHVIAHDDAYGRFNAGQACLLLTIDASIRAGSRAFHFLWGDAEYKRRFLATPRPLYSFAMFRGPRDKAIGFVAYAPRLARRGAKALRGEVEHWLPPASRAHLQRLAAQVRSWRKGGSP